MKPVHRLLLTPTEEQTLDKEMKDIEAKILVGITIGANSITHVLTSPADAVGGELRVAGYNYNVSCGGDPNRARITTRNEDAPIEALCIFLPVKK